MEALDHGGTNRDKVASFGQPAQRRARGATGHLTEPEIASRDFEPEIGRGGRIVGKTIEISERCAGKALARRFGPGNTRDIIVDVEHQ